MSKLAHNVSANTFSFFYANAYTTLSEFAVFLWFYWSRKQFRWMEFWVLTRPQKQRRSINTHHL